MGLFAGNYFKDARTKHGLLLSGSTGRSRTVYVSSEEADCILISGMSGKLQYSFVIRVVWPFNSGYIFKMLATSKANI